jgi:ubiquinone/menaquinone biosynthesis C-methylase UbiE
LAVLILQGAGSLAVTRRARPASERAFDPVSQLYDQWYEIPLGKIVDELEKDLLYGLARVDVPGRAMDVGTGTGHFAADLANRGWQVVGLDLSAAMLAVAKEKPANTAWIRADAAALPCASREFDLVLSVTALEFVARRQEAVREMWRLVNPGGSLVVAVLNAWSPWAWARRREGQGQETPFSHAHFFTPLEFLSLLRPLGKVTWNSSVFVGPSGECLALARGLERMGRTLLRPFGALLAGRVEKCS